MPTAGRVVCARRGDGFDSRPDAVLTLASPFAAVQTLDPMDLLFVGGFVAVLCLGIAGLVTVAAPAGLPAFVSALRGAFVLFGAAFLALGVLGAVAVALVGD
ncbi:hypothetical protein GCM10009030_35180 [Haloarcula pellucida]|uniref:Uncharacterized protein n=2 Tax=Haloarcula pellucida TaxID=1427151 RepID=A0A830GTM9_9EURY|nr:hypothetical protein GCM10009030_35180 [Halomicroarcula pellucida]